MTLYATRTEELLAAHGFRRTPGRVALLKLLASEKGPVTADYLETQLQDTLDRAALYRALDAFAAEKMLVQYDFGHGHAHYELAHEKPHHHHAVCSSCGRIDDIPAQDAPHLTAKALKAAPQFKSFTRHSLEFYGQCVSCAS
jgi:Fe2+ or Zn2+ uptake regulation protein